MKTNSDLLQALNFRNLISMRSTSTLMNKTISDRTALCSPFLINQEKESNRYDRNRKKKRAKVQKPLKMPNKSLQANEINPKMLLSPHILISTGIKGTLSQSTFVQQATINNFEHEQLTLKDLITMTSKKNTFKQVLENRQKQNRHTNQNWNWNQNQNQKSDRQVRKKIQAIGHPYLEKIYGFS